MFYSGVVRPTNLKYFTSVNSWQAKDWSMTALTKIYRLLSKQYHPDLGGDTKKMQEVNAEYELASKYAIWHERKGYEAEQTAEYAADGKEWRGQRMTVEQLTWVHEKIITAIKAIIHLDDIKIEIMGTWLWVSGDTKPHAALFGKNGLGMIFSPQKQAWFIMGIRSHSKHRYGLDEIRGMHGSVEVTDDEGYTPSSRPKVKRLAGRR